MLQAKHFLVAAAVGTVGLLAATAGQAETTPETEPLPAQSATPETLESPEAIEIEADAEAIDEAANEATGDVAEAEPLECPPGQFPSAFSDVYPFHWAYQAVNNLASPNMQCFDLPEEFR